MWGMGVCMTATSGTDEKVEEYEAALEWFHQNTSDDATSVEELESVREFFTQIADAELSPAFHEAAADEVAEQVGFMTKKAARRELASVRGVDRDFS